MLLPVSDCLIRRLIACARYGPGKEDALSHRGKMRCARQLLNEWGNIKEIFELKLNLKLHSYNLFSEISESKYLEVIEKGDMGYFPDISINGKDDITNILLKFERQCIRCHLSFCGNKREEITSMLEEMEFGILQLEEANCMDSQFLADLYCHYFVILLDILLVYEEITISDIPFWDTIMDNDFVYLKWNESLREKYDIKQHTNRIRKFIEWRGNFFRHTVSDCNGFMQDGTTDNRICDIEYHYRYLNNKFNKYDTPDERDKFIQIHLLRAICAIIGYKLFEISEEMIDKRKLFSSIYGANAWNVQYLRKMKDTLLLQKQNAESAEINSILKMDTPLKQVGKNTAYIFEKDEQEYIAGKMDILFDKGILDRKYRVSVINLLDTFLSTGRSPEPENKIAVNKSKTELLYGFFFSFCKEKQKAKSEAFTCFICSVFTPVAGANTLNHNWNKYKRQYMNSK